MDRRAPPWVGAPEARAKFAEAARLWDMPTTAMSHPGVWWGTHRAPRLDERRPMRAALPWVGARAERSYGAAGLARRVSNGACLRASEARRRRAPLAIGERSSPMDPIRS